MNSDNHKNKTILITGGVEGIGLECAKKFIGSENKVIVTCKSNQSYEKFLELGLEKKIQIERLDLTNEISIEKLYQKIDSLDILINNSTLFKGGI